MANFMKVAIFLCVLILLMTAPFAQADSDHYQAEMLARREKEQKEWMERQETQRRADEQQRQQAQRMMYESNRPGNPGVFGQAAGNAYRYGY